MIQGRFGNLLMYLWAILSCFVPSSVAFVVHLSLYTTVQWGSVLQSILQHSRIKNRWGGKQQNNQNKPLERQVVEMLCSLFQLHYTRLLTYRKSLEIYVGKTVSPWMTFSLGLVLVVGFETWFLFVIPYWCTNVFTVVIINRLSPT